MTTYRLGNLRWSREQQDRIPRWLSAAAPQEAR